MTDMVIGASCCIYRYNDRNLYLLFILIGLHILLREFVGIIQHLIKTSVVLNHVGKYRNVNDNGKYKTNDAKSETNFSFAVHCHFPAS